MKKILLLLLFFWSPLFGEDSSLLSLGVGVFNVVKGKKSTNFQLEYRSNFAIYENQILLIRPLAGIMATTRKSSYYYGGIAFDIFITPSIVFTPSFAPGIYVKGDGKNLGFPLEFRSSAELSYRFKNCTRLGAMFYHMSNASIGHKNPGTECLVFFLAVPVGFYTAGR